jgi:thymidylate synthase (FAD)
MEIKLYKDIEVSILRATENPEEILTIAMNEPMDIKQSKFEFDQRLQGIITAKHNTVLEFVDLIFHIKGASGAFLRQFRTHRIASYVTSSHHYKDATKFGMTFDKQPNDKVMAALSILHTEFEKEKGNIGKEEARMWLPVAQNYNILFKINASSLANFFEKRLCNRNCKEMRIVALKMYNLCLDYFYPLFSKLGPVCMFDCCNQGKMCCKKPLSLRSIDKELEAL